MFTKSSRTRHAKGRILEAPPHENCDMLSADPATKCEAITARAPVVVSGHLSQRACFTDFYPTGIKHPSDGCLLKIPLENNLAI